MKSKKWKVILKLAISIIILVYIFSKIDYKEIFRLDLFDLKYFLLAFLLVPIRLIVKGYRWQSIMKKAIPNLSFSIAMKSMFVSIALGLITPMRVGQAGIVSYLKSDSNFKTGFFAFFEVIMDLIIVIFASAISFLLIFLIPSESLILKTSDVNAIKSSGYNLLYFPSYIYFGSAAIFFIVAFISILFIAKTGPFFNIIAKYGGSKLEKLLSRFSEIKLYTKKELAGITLNSFFVFLFNIVQFQLLTYTFFRIPILIIFISFPLTMLGVSLPITIAGIGAREGTSAWIYSSFGVSSAVGVKASFLLFLLNTVFPSIVGIIIYNLRIHDKQKEK
jgi:uncharacterized protein (TIRG00374 family)